MPAGYIPDPELFELIRRVVRQYGNSFQPRPKSPKRVRRVTGNANSTKNLTQFAYVVEAAEADGGEGMCVLLDENMDAFDTNGNPLVLDESDPAYEQDKVDEVAVEFRCAQVYAPCPERARIWLSSNEAIQPGSELSEHIIWGVCVDAADYLYALNGASAEKSLVIPTGGDGPEDIKWQGAEC